MNRHAERAVTEAADGGHPAGWATRIDWMLAQDLLDALWLEDFQGFRARCRSETEPDGSSVLVVTLDGETSVRWLGTPLHGLRPLRLRKTAPPVVMRSVKQGATIHETLTVTQTLAALRRARGSSAEGSRLVDYLQLARQQMERTFSAQHDFLARVSAAPRSLIAWEAICCLRDRPFHPFARAKVWPDIPGECFDLESGEPIDVRWVAFERDALLLSTALSSNRSGDPQPFAAAFLGDAARAQLAQRAAARGTSAGALWLPVHPWQWQHLQLHRRELVRRCVDLGDGLCVAMPTASLRTLSVTPDKAAANTIHLKLSLSMQALGAARAMPPRYLYNGALAEACLDGLRERDAWLRTHVELCGEHEWCAVRAGGAGTSSIPERGELACLIRRYPANNGWLLPMAACAAVTHDARLPAFEALCADPGLAALAGPLDDAPAERAWRVFGALARLLIETGLRCFGWGVMPELHGQNVMVRIDSQGLRGLTLRDHDTLRICPATMTERGVGIPAYIVDPNTPNTLVLERAQTLLAYFQTLAIEVNLYAILAAVAECYNADEATGWRIVERTMHDVVATALADSVPAQQCAQRALFDEPMWPFKQILAPLAASASIGTGMPSGLGAIANPLRGAARLQETPCP